MRIICDRGLLVSHISSVSKATSSKAATMPILDCCLLTAGPAGFKLMTNDLEMAIETEWAAAEVLEAGNVAMDAKVFFDIIRRMPGNAVEIRVDAKNLAVIKSDKSEFKILGKDANEFPALPEVEDAKVFEIPAASLREMIRQTIFSVSQDPSKPIMTGVLLEFADEYARMVSCDGFRISLRQTELDRPAEAAKVVIPGKTLSEINKILPSDEETIVQLQITPRHIVFKLDNCMVVSRLLDGEYINYKNMFTSDATTDILVNRDEFLGCIERASLISRDSKKSPIHLKIENDLMVITSNTEMGAAYEEMAIEHTGLNIERMDFNPRYLTDVMRVLDCERVHMRFTKPIAPCIIEVEGSADYRFLVLGLRLYR